MSHVRKSAAPVVAVAVVFVSLAAPHARAVNMLVDPGFETSPALQSIGTTITNYPGFQGQWGTEVGGAKVGPQPFVVGGGANPFGGAQMLSMPDDGGVARQTGQVTSVAALAAGIDAGLATVAASAYFNVGLEVQTASASVAVHFVDAGGIHSSTTGPDVAVPLVLDGQPTTWQQALLVTPVPVGTRWIYTQVAYANPVLAVTGQPVVGYVDDAFMEVRVLPEPGAALAAGAAGAAALARRRRRR